MGQVSLRGIRKPDGDIPLPQGVAALPSAEAGVHTKRVEAGQDIGLTRGVAASRAVAGGSRLPA